SSVYGVLNLSSQSTILLSSVFSFFIIRPPLSSTLFPYTTLFRSIGDDGDAHSVAGAMHDAVAEVAATGPARLLLRRGGRWLPVLAVVSVGVVLEIIMIFVYRVWASSNRGVQGGAF